MLLFVVVFFQLDNDQPLSVLSTLACVEISQSGCVCVYVCVTVVHFGLDTCQIMHLQQNCIAAASPERISTRINIHTNSTQNSPI